MEMEKIKEIIYEKLRRITDKEIDTNANLLGEPNYLEPRDLVYLFLELQEEYQICIAEEDLKNRSFSTITNIVSIIGKYMNG